MTTNYNIVLHISCSDSLDPNDLEFLCKCLFIPKMKDEKYDLDIGIKTNTCLTTKVKSKFLDHDKTNFSSNSDYLIFFRSASAEELPSIHTDLITVLNNTNDPNAYQDLTRDPNYYIIGVNHIRFLSVPECRYLANLLNRFVDNERNDQFFPVITIKPFERIENFKS